jgi:Flp pilus assembly protein TadD
MHDGTREALVVALIQRARLMVNQSLPAEAWLLLARVAHLQPMHAEVEYLMGIALLHTESEPVEAIEHFDRALAGGFDEFWVRYHRAQALTRLGRVELALLDVSRARELKPDHDGARAVQTALAVTDVGTEGD